jgi:hypothetical protein
MNPRRSNTRWLWPSLFAATALLYWGCQTMPKKFVNAEAGFLVSRYRVEVKRDAKQIPAMNSYARIVAEERLSKMKEGDTRPALRRYQHGLNEPITVGPEALNKEPGLGESQRRVISEWLGRNPGHNSFQAEKVSETWQRQVAWVELQIRQLTGEFDATLSRAKQKAAAKLFEEAVKECQAARRIDPEDVEAQAAYRDIYRSWAADKCGKLLESIAVIRAKVATRAQGYETDQFSDRGIQDCEADLNQAQTQLDEFRVWGNQSPESRLGLAEQELALGQTETQLAGLRGTSWAQRIWLGRGPHRYWAAYQYFISATAIQELDLGHGRKHRLKDYEVAAIHQRLREAYERMLPEGMAFYIRNAARAAEGQGANGLSLILCRMAQELRDYAVAQRMQLSPEVETLRSSLSLSMNKAQEGIKAALTRQLVIKDFQKDFQSPGEDGRALAARIYDAWLKRYPAEGFADPPAPFWLVEAKRDAEKTTPIDYVLSGTVSKCYVDTLAPKELSAERIEIGLEPKEIPNPDRKEAKKTPTVFEQERWIYERRISQHTKDAILRADILLAHDGKTITCATVDQEFDGTRQQLPGIRLSDQETHHQAITFQPKRSNNRADLQVDKLPPNKSAELSSDREVAAALIDFARDAVLANLQEYVALFPLNNLLREGLRNESKPVQAAELFGQCLEYCSQLTALDKNLAAKTGGDWIVWRKALAERITELKKQQWRSADPKLTAKADDLWELAVASAIQACEQISRDGSGV